MIYHNWYNIIIVSYVQFNDLLLYVLQNYHHSKLIFVHHAYLQAFVSCEKVFFLVRTFKVYSPSYF